MTQQLTPAQQQQQAIIQEIGQYIAAKWGKPYALVLYDGTANAQFLSILQNVSEGQLLIGGTELIARAEVERRRRFQQQLNLVSI